MHGGFFTQEYFLPHGHCYLWQPALLWTHFTTDLLIGFSYIAISLILYFLVRKIELRFSPVVLAFGAFIAACGATHFIEVWTLWYPEYWIAAAVKVVTALASVSTAIWLFRLRPEMFKVVKSTHLAEERRQALEDLNRSLEERIRVGTEAARQSEDQMRIISDSVPAFISYIDRDFRYRFVNDFYVKWFGVPKEQIIGKTLFEFLGHDTFDRQHRYMVEALSGRSVSFEATISKGREGFRETQVNYIPDISPTGVVRGFIVLTHDATEQKRMHWESLFLRGVSDTLAKSLDYKTTLSTVARLAVPALADICFVDVIGEDGRSYRAEAFTGGDEKMALSDQLKKYPMNLSENSFPGSEILNGRSLLIPKVSDQFFDDTAGDSAYIRILKGMKIRSFLAVPLESRGRILGSLSFASIGERTLDQYELKLAQELAYRSALAVENSLLYLEQKHIAEELKASQVELEKAVRVRDEFLSVASHELRTPLTGLKLQNQIRHRKFKKGQDEFASPDRIERMLTDDSRQLEKLNRLVDDMLDISRLNTGKFTMVQEVFDLGELLNEVAERFQPQLEEVGCTFTFEIKNDVVIKSDRYRIEQVISNLLTNALRYGPGKPIHLEVRHSETRAQIIVKDKGIGIASENHERIFNRFERAVSATGISGLGLGLYIVKQILEAQGGTIHVESELGQGATFIAELPLYISTKSPELEQEL